MRLQMNPADGPGLEHARLQSQPEYEYKTVKLEAATLRGAARRQQRMLNKLAADGWELMSETGKHGIAYGTRKNLTFRRRRR